MPQTQVSFSNGEIAPELYGRTDLPTYAHSAASIKNFVVLQTGGLRKRAGTQYVRMVDDNAMTETGAWRVIPIFYDTETSGLIVLGVRDASGTLRCRIIKGDGTMNEWTQVLNLVVPPNKLQELKYTQIGDTIIFTAEGVPTFKAKVYWDTYQIEWALIGGTREVAMPPEITATASGFKTANATEGFVNWTRKYALYGVKNGVYSKPQTKDVNITLYWVEGAKVTLTFTPNWQDADYYVLAVQRGAYYGVIGDFYPTDGTAILCTWSQTGTSLPTNNTINEATVITKRSNFSQLTASPNDKNTDGTHKNSILLQAEDHAYYINATTDYATVPAMALHIWMGAACKVNGVVTNAQTTETLSVSLYDNDNTLIQTWNNVNPTYGNEALELQLDNPTTSGSGRFKIVVSRDVLVRGVKLSSDTAKRTFVDVNTSPGSIVGVQQRLTVGDNGMDCAICELWEQRLFFARSSNKPFTLWFSQVGDLENFYANRPQTESDAFSISIPSRVASQINHAITNKWFILFTESGEYQVSSSGGSGFSYNTATIQQISTVGASKLVPPVLTEERVVFVSGDRQSLFDMDYDYAKDSIVPNNRSIHSRHLTERAKIRKLCVQRYPEPVVWCLLEDGSLLSMTYLPTHEVIAWAHHEIPPAGEGVKVTDIFTSGSDIVGEGHETASQIFIVQERNADKRKIWIERLRANIVGTNPTKGTAKCADHCGYPQNAYPDEGIDPEKAVEAELVTLPMATENNALMFETKVVRDVALKTVRAGTLEVRPYATGLQVASSIYQPKKTPREHAQTVELVSEVVKILPRSYFSETGQMVIKSADQWPCTITALSFKI